MPIVYYSALTDQQFHELKQQLDHCKADRAKHRRLYEIQYSVFDLTAFQRPSNSKVVCVHRKVLEAVKNPQLASQVLEQSFGGQVVEFVPALRSE